MVSIPLFIINFAACKLVVLANGVKMNHVPYASTNEQKNSLWIKKNL